MRPDGTDERRLTHDPGNDSDASWSPDSRKLVYSNDASGVQEIVTIDISTGVKHQLTTTGIRDAHPHWSKVPGCVADLFSR